MSRQYTPGPWWAQENSAYGWSVLTYRDSESADNFRIRDTGATICGLIGDHTEERTSGNEEANARLIAAAPDLLEALQYAAQFLADEVEQRGLAGSDMTDYQDEAAQALDRVEAAIAKARISV